MGTRLNNFREELKRAKVSENVHATRVFESLEKDLEGHFQDINIDIRNPLAKAYTDLKNKFSDLNKYPDGFVPQQEFLSVVRGHLNTAKEKLNDDIDKSTLSKDEKKKKKEIVAAEISAAVKLLGEINLNSIQKEVVEEHTKKHWWEIGADLKPEEIQKVKPSETDETGEAIGVAHTGSEAPTGKGAFTKRLADNEGWIDVPGSGKYRVSIPEDGPNKGKLQFELKSSRFGSVVDVAAQAVIDSLEKDGFEGKDGKPRSFNFKFSKPLGASQYQKLRDRMLDELPAIAYKYYGNKLTPEELAQKLPHFTVNAQTIEYDSQRGFARIHGQEGSKKDSGKTMDVINDRWFFDKRHLGGKPKTDTDKAGRTAMSMHKQIKKIHDQNNKRNFIGNTSNQFSDEFKEDPSKVKKESETSKKSKTSFTLGKK